MYLKPKQKPLLSLARSCMPVTLICHFRTTVFCSIRQKARLLRHRRKCPLRLVGFGITITDIFHLPEYGSAHIPQHSTTGWNRPCPSSFSTRKLHAKLSHDILHPQCRARSLNAPLPRHGSLSSCASQHSPEMVPTTHALQVLVVHAKTRQQPRFLVCFLHNLFSASTIFTVDGPYHPTRTSNNTNFCWAPLCNFFC